jgi:hypothetical protein
MAPMNQTEILSAFPTESSSQSKRGRFDSCKTQHFSGRLVNKCGIFSMPHLLLYIIIYLYFTFFHFQIKVACDSGKSHY